MASTKANILLVSVEAAQKTLQTQVEATRDVFDTIEAKSVPKHQLRRTVVWSLENKWLSESVGDGLDTTNSVVGYAGK